MRLRELFRASIPLIAFAALLALAQAWTGSADWRLPVRTLAVAAAVVLAGRLLPWKAWLRRIPPASPLFAGALYIWMLRHFAAIFMREARRVLIARRLAAPRAYRTGWFSSLANALVSLLLRIFIRAERFYAAQLLRGIGR